MYFVNRSFAAVLLMASSSTCFALGPYGGVSFGIMDVDGVESNALNGGLTLGYDFSAETTTFGMEAEFTTSLSDGEIINNVDYSISTQALYLTGKLDFNDQFYGKARIGFIREEVDIDFVGSETDNGLSAGVGIGFRLNGQTSLEGEITMIEEDVNFFSAGIRYAFY